jgi:ribosome-binding protein aMBF1 (putative translation factor)
MLKSKNVKISSAAFDVCDNCSIFAEILSTPYETPSTQHQSLVSAAIARCNSAAGNGTEERKQDLYGCH